MKRDDLYIPARRLIHDHMLSLRCRGCIYVAFTSKKKGGGGQDLVDRLAPRWMALVMKVGQYHGSHVGEFLKAAKSQHHEIRTGFNYEEGRSAAITSSRSRVAIRTGSEC